MLTGDLRELLTILPVLLLSVVVHEVAHGVAAERAGDPTARMLGRITLNPVPHIDPIGSLLVPLLLVLSHSSIFFAWAKPVPVNPYNFRRPKRDDIVVSLAGPLSNLALALGFCLLLLGTVLVVSTRGGISNWSGSLIQLFRYGIWINLILAFFNLIPIPPLDGSHILGNLLPYEAARRYERLRPYGFILLLGLMWFGALSVLLRPASWLFAALLQGIAALAGLAVG